MAYEEVEVWLQPFLTSALNGMYGHLGDPISFIPARKAPGIQRIRGKVGPRGGVDTLDKRTKSLTSAGNQTKIPWSSSPITMQTMLYQLLSRMEVFQNCKEEKIFWSILQLSAYAQPVLVSLWNIMRHCFSQRPTETPVNSKMALDMANRKRLCSV